MPTTRKQKSSVRKVKKHQKFLHAKHALRVHGECVSPPRRVKNRIQHQRRKAR